jgi:hypothetical protein
MRASSQGYVLERGRFGTRAVITTHWNHDIQAQLLKEEIAELELNDGKGWRGDNLSFLGYFSNLSALTVIDLTIKSIEPIHALHRLRTLDILTYCRTEIRFDQFPNLTECGIEWRDKATSLFDCRGLRKLYINRFNGRDLRQFEKLTNLESLAILGASIISLEGLGVLHDLRSLRLGDLRKLKSLKGIDKLAKLEKLEVNTCPKIPSISELSELFSLRELHLNNLGNIQTLEPIRRLRNLEWVTFYESTNVLDGDLSPLVALPKLMKISFQNRRHYSHRRESFGLAYSGGGELS